MPDDLRFTGLQVDATNSDRGSTRAPDHPDPAICCGSGHRVVAGNQKVGGCGGEQQRAPVGGLLGFRLGGFGVGLDSSAALLGVSSIL